MSIVATTIQRCVDEKTMNNKKFKAKLNDLYKEIIQPKSKYRKCTSKPNKITICLI